MGVAEVKIKATSAKVDIEIEAELKLDAAIGEVLFCPFLAQNYTFLVGWGGWMVGESDDKAKLNSSFSWSWSSRGTTPIFAGTIRTDNITNQFLAKIWPESFVLKIFEKMDMGLKLEYFRIDWVII